MEDDRVLQQKGGKKKKGIWMSFSLRIVVTIAKR